MSASIYNILIPIDFSDQSIQALKYAKAIIGKQQTTVYFIFVIDQNEIEIKNNDFSDKDDLKKSFEQKLIRIIEQEWSNCTNYTWVLFVEQGKVYDRVLEKAASVNAGLIIMGCNSAGDYKNRFLGSNSLRIMRTCPIPIMLANQYSQLSKFINITLPIDLSKEARQKLEKAIAMAKLDSDIVIHVVCVVFDADEYLINRMGQKLTQVKSVLDKHKIKYSAEIVKTSLEFESLGEIIADYARKIESDVIMLMTQQELSYTPYFVSSLAQEIINISEVPVMTIAPN